MMRSVLLLSGLSLLTACRAPSQSPTTTPAPLVVAQHLPRDADGHVGKPTPPEVSAPAARSEDDSSKAPDGPDPCDSTTTGPKPWITLCAPPLKDEWVARPGPAWSFRSKLPALDRKAGLVYFPYSNDVHQASTVNFSVQVRTIDGDRLVRTIPLLTEEEFRKGELGDLTAEGRPAKYLEIEARTRARIAAVSAELETKKLEAMIPCKFTPSTIMLYQCSDPETFECGALKITHTPGGQLAWSRGEGPKTVRTIPRIRGFLVPLDGSGSAEPIMIPTHDCFTSAYVDIKGKWLAGEIAFICQGGGDWCRNDPLTAVIPLR